MGGDTFVDPTALRPLPRTIVPDVVVKIKPARFPWFPYVFVLLAINAFPGTWSIYQYHHHQHEACEQDLHSYLRIQGAISCAYVAGVGVPIARRIQWVGSLRDTVSEIPELWVYYVATSLVWFEFICFCIKRRAEYVHASRTKA